MCLCFCVFQRRRSAEDELAMRGFLQEGDLISVSCTFLLFYRATSVLALLSDWGKPCRDGVEGNMLGALLPLCSFSFAQNDALGFVTCDHGEDPMVFPFFLKRVAQAGLELTVYPRLASNTHITVSFPEF